MKKLKLLSIGFKESSLSFVSLFVVLSVVLFILNYTFSQYLFLNRSHELFGNGQFENSFVFNNITPYDEVSIKNLGENLKTLKKYDFISNVIYRIISSVELNGETYQLELYDEDIYPIMYSSLYKGKWVTKEAETYCVVAGGVSPKDLDVDETILLKKPSETENTTLKVKLTGILPYPPMIFKLGYYTSVEKAFTSDYFFINQRVLYLPKNEETLAYIDELNGGIEPPIKSGIVKFKESATTEEREQIKDLIGKNAIVTETDIILENSKTNVAENLRKSLPLPLFMLIVTTLSYISIVVLNIYKNKAKYIVYHIAGCKKSTMTALSITQVSFSLIFTTIFVCAAVLLLSSLAASGVYGLPGLIFGWQNVILTCIVSAVIFIIIVLIATLMMRRFSPIEQLRLVKE
ncbi:MAG: hypothetical protein PHY15_06675 [Eubacteriales bacterium]|nr:hypothetical protein [Eubacteriales bacterium]MDD4475752.1 hypothetical protein [Eubacteriales bacterium]